MLRVLKDSLPIPITVPYSDLSSAADTAGGHNRIIDRRAKNKIETEDTNRRRLADFFDLDGLSEEDEEGRLGSLDMVMEKGKDKLPSL